MVLLICYLLVNDTPPLAIPGNILSVYSAFYKKQPGKDGVPGEDFFCKCRTIAEVAGETITAIELGRREWKVAHTDATTRRQTPFQTLVLGLIGDDSTIMNLFVSSCIFMKTEDAVDCVEAIEDKVSHVCFRQGRQYLFNDYSCFQIDHTRKRLTRLREFVKELGEDPDKYLPPPENICPVHDHPDI